jgi:hypothetical protein
MEWRTVTRGGKTFRQRFKVGQKEPEPEEITKKISMTEDNVEYIEVGMGIGLPESMHGCNIGLVEFKTGEKGIYKVTGQEDDITGETAYADLAKTMGWSVVPQTEKVDLGTGVGTCQEFIYGEHPVWSTADIGTIITEDHFESLAEIFAMDVVVGNVDRHNENIMIVDDKVWAIDNDTWVQNAGNYTGGDANYSFMALDFRAEGAGYTEGRSGFNKLCTALECSDIYKDGFKEFKSIVVTKLEELLQKEQVIKDHYPVTHRDRKGAIEHNIDVAKKYVEANK